MSLSSEAVKRWRAATKARMVQSMGSKCQCCGYNVCDGALAFHHLDPLKKDIGIGAIRGNPASWATIINELRKCILVCHNCHSEIHAGIRKLPETYSVFDETFVDYKTVFQQAHNNCPVCDKLKTVNLKFCSPKCASANRRKIDWDSIDLLYLMKHNTISQLEDMLCISNAAIYKRRDKLLKNNIPQNSSMVHGPDC